MNNSYKNLLTHIYKPMSLDSMKFIYEANQIKYDRCKIYGDFVQSLLTLIFDTYMGDDVTDTRHKVKHFKWCWEKTLLDFKNEGITLFSEKLYNYFSDYMIEFFYNVKKPFYYVDDLSLKIWSNVFDYGKPKTNYEMDTLVEIYLIFENSLKK